MANLLRPPMWFWLLVSMGGGSLFMAWLHAQMHGEYNMLQAAVGSFIVINFVISLWEIALLLHISKVKREYEANKKVYGTTRRTQAVVKMVCTPMSLFEALQLKTWTIIWSTYGLYDVSYAQDTSFGFWIDAGNGITTILPQITFLLAMTFSLPALAAEIAGLIAVHVSTGFGAWLLVALENPWVQALLSPRGAGIVGLISTYQALYGTVVYFSSFLYHKRYRNGSLFEMVAFVVCTNGVWFVFPLVAIFAAIQMIDMNDSAHIFGWAK